MGTNIKYLTTVHAADFLGLARQTLEKWRLDGSGPRFHKFGRAVRYREDDLIAWAESRIQTSTSHADACKVER